MEQTKVMFRKWKDTGTIDAIFPELPGTLMPNTCLGYSHIGQHSACDDTYYLGKTVPATPKEYAALKSELESIGYKLQVVARMSSKADMIRQKAIAADD